MNYRHLLTLAVGISLATTASQGFCTPTVQAKKVNLSVVYAAGPNAHRTKEFKEFLASRFSSVSVVPVSTFKPEAVTGHQVLVVDAPLKLPLDFRRPTILVATAGVMTAMNSKLKFDWYCQCLAKDAHDVDTKHPIFNKPFKVDIQYQDRPMPGHYQMISTPGSLPKVLKTWRVAKIDMNDGTGMIPGMVSTGDGFLDSPDCEVISGGINTKSPEAVAIGRQGSFLMWGFETAPSNMTDSAKDAFTNCVAYIAKFDGAPVLVRKKGESREHVLALVNLFLNSKEYHQTTVNNAREHNAHGEALKKKQESGGKLSPNEQQFMSVYRVWDEPTYETFLESLYKVVPPTILQQTGKDSQAIARYLHDNKGYIVPGGGPLMSLDPDAKALGIPNNDVRILEKCISLLESGQQQDLALRVLKRYTEVEFATPAEWKKWLTTNRSKLFFSDMGGFKFFLNITPSAPVAAMPEPTTANPTVWQAALDTQGPVKPGSTVNLTVRLRLAAGWHVYGDVPKGSPFIPTSFVAKLPKGLTFEGTWEYPKLTAYDAQTSIIQGDVEFKRSIKIGAGVKGKMKVPLTVSWQSCDASKCLPPTQKTLTIEIAVD